MSPELAKLAECRSNDPKFQAEAKSASKETLDQYLTAFPLADKYRTIVEVERKFRMENLEAIDSERRHRESIAEDRKSNRIALWAIGIAILSLLVSLFAVFK